MVHDSLGVRMKTLYEHPARLVLPRRVWTVVRLDGRAFHGYTRGLERPFDHRLMDDMAAVAAALAAEASGCRLAYTQSDEISLVLTDRATPTTEPWFGGVQQKIVSVLAAAATAEFNARRPGGRALFDARAFTIPDPDEVINYLVWRQQDAARNSVQMVAQAHYSPRELHGKNVAELRVMLLRDHQVNWHTDYPERCRAGTVVHPETRVGEVEYVDRRTGETHRSPPVERRVWTTTAAPHFASSRPRLAALLDPAGAPR